MPSNEGGRGLGFQVPDHVAVGHAEVLPSVESEYLIRANIPGFPFSVYKVGLADGEKAMRVVQGISYTLTPDAFELKDYPMNGPPINDQSNGLERITSREEIETRMRSELNGLIPLEYLGQYVRVTLQRNQVIGMAQSITDGTLKLSPYLSDVDPRQNHAKIKLFSSPVYVRLEQMADAVLPAPAELVGNLQRVNGHRFLRFLN